jgi:CheY-like chemotaxis protein
MSEGALILIIEDNARNLKLARDLLNHAGYETLEAENAEDGLALARARHPDLVLMDVQLPGMDGVQALGRLRYAPETRDIPVIALTAFAMKDDRERFLAAGFDRYLAKPLDIHELPRQVAAALAAAGANA